MNIRTRIRALSLLVLFSVALSSLPVRADGFSASDDIEPYTWKQTDPRWADVVIGYDPWTDAQGVLHEEETLGHAGCFITSVAILAKANRMRLSDGSEITPGTLGEALYDGGSCKYLTAKGGVNKYESFVDVIPGIHYMATENGDNPLKTVKNWLTREFRVFIVAAVKGGGHFVAVRSYTDDEVLICDPGYRQTTLADYTVSSFYIYKINESEIPPEAPTGEGDSWKVLATSVRIRSGAGLSYSEVARLSQGDIFTVTEQKEADGYLWGKTRQGWVALIPRSGEDPYCEKLSSPDRTFTVTYRLTAGTGCPPPQIKQDGVPLILSEQVPVRDGYYFLGWAEDPEAASALYAAGETYAENRSVVFYGIWIKNPEFMAFGIDVSSHQKKVDWQKVAAAGVSFVLLRAGTTNGGPDTSFEENYRGATEAGLDVGCYYYISSSDKAGIKKDFDALMKVIEGKTFQYPVYADVESTFQDRLSSEELTGLICYFMQMVEDAGFYSGVYCGQSRLNDRFIAESLGGKEHLWIARWNANGTLVRYLGDYFGIHQYSQSGHVDGIETTVDLDVCYVNYPAIIGGLDPAHVHTFTDTVIEPTCIYPGCTLHECDCGKKFADTYTEPLGHDYVETVIPPTVTDYGYTLHRCSLCGDEYADDYTLPTGSVPGDINGDGITNMVDYLMLKAKVLGTREFTPEETSRMDMDGDGIINMIDYLIVKRIVINAE